MNLAAAILIAMKLAVPCGNSAWSVEPVPVAECTADAKKCPGAKRSSFYRGWVRKESAATCEARYAKQARSLASELQGSERAIQEAGLVVGIAVNEGALREDVQFGRGRSGHVKRSDKQHDDAGGQGRGPGNEACWMQILPSMSRSYGGPEALLADTEEARRLCFRAALDQLRAARLSCSSVKKRTRPTPLGPEVVSPLYAVVSAYGIGSCASSNQGKTERRVNTILWVTAVIEREMRKPSEKS
jgi:hypothetical protein